MPEEVGIDKEQSEAAKLALKGYVEKLPEEKGTRSAFLGILQSKEELTLEALEEQDTSKDYQADQMKAFLTSVLGKGDKPEQFSEVLADIKTHLEGSLESDDNPAVGFANFLVSAREKYKETVPGVEDFFDNYMEELSKDEAIQGIAGDLFNGGKIEGLDALDDGDPKTGSEGQKQGDESKGDPHQYKKDTLAVAATIGFLFVPVAGPLMALAVAAAYINYRAKGATSQNASSKEEEEQEMQKLKDKFYAEFTKSRSVGSDKEVLEDVQDMTGVFSGDDLPVNNSLKASHQVVRGAKDELRSAASGFEAAEEHLRNAGGVSARGAATNVAATTPPQPAATEAPPPAATAPPPPQQPKPAAPLPPGDKAAPAAKPAAPPTKKTTTWVERKAGKAPAPTTKEGTGHAQGDSQRA